MTETKVSIGFMFHKNDLALRRALEGISSLTYPRNLIQLIFLDNSSDGATDTAKAWVDANPGYADFTLIREFGNRPHLRNTIIAHANTEYLLFIDSDVEVHPETIQKLLSHFEDREVFMSSIAGELIDPPILFYAEKYKKDSGKTVSETDYAWFGCTMLRLAYLDKVGHLDESWVVQNEDGAYVQRAKALSFKVIVDKTILCKHHRRYSVLGVIKKGLTTQEEPIELQMRYGWNLKWVRRFLFWNVFFSSIPLAFIWSPFPFFALVAFVFALNAIKIQGIGKLVAPIGGIVNAFFMLIGTYYGLVKVLHNKIKKEAKVENP